MKEKIEKKKYVWKYGFAFVLVVLGIILNFLKIGNNFLGFETVGTWIIYVGLGMFAITTLRFFSKSKKIIDERAEFISARAARITFSGIIMFAFAIMIIDGINPIKIPYSYFMSYFITGIVAVYFISYKLLEKKF